MGASMVWENSCASHLTLTYSLAAAGWGNAHSCFYSCLFRGVFEVMYLTLGAGGSFQEPQTAWLVQQLMAFLHLTWSWDKPGLDASWKWFVLTWRRQIPIQFYASANFCAPFAFRADLFRNSNPDKLGGWVNWWSVEPFDATAQTPASGTGGCAFLKIFCS